MSLEGLGLKKDLAVHEYAYRMELARRSTTKLLVMFTVTS
mgnify:CR=1 FL=1